MTLFHTQCGKKRLKIARLPVSAYSSSVDVTQCVCGHQPQKLYKNLVPARFFVFSGCITKRDPPRSFMRVRKKQLSATKSCVCINPVNDMTDRSLMNASTMSMSLLKTAHNAAVVVVRVVVVVGNAP
ncbi:IlvB leader peptide [Kosakonia oryziphila]|uniref:IlvB leader peptide n=2 Tax=Kosakonia TaxID=1330547 RepID=A0A1C4C7V3_9ENTR|nr:IlvB leader peptide [Kosakonia oryziphila]